MAAVRDGEHDAVGNLAQNARRQVLCEHVAVLASFHEVGEELIDAGPKLTLPVAVTVFPRDIPRLPRSWIEDAYSNLIHYELAILVILGIALDILLIVGVETR